MDISCIVFGIGFIIFGLLVLFRKLPMFKKAWKDMSEEDRDKAKLKLVCRNIGCVIILSGILFLVSGLVKEFREQFFLLSMIIWLVLSGIDVIFILKSKRYK